MSVFSHLNLLIAYLVVHVKMENSFERKKKSVKFCPKVPLVPTGQEFWPECNFAVFAPKPTDRKFSGSKRKWKILSKEKKNSGKFCTKMSQVPTVPAKILNLLDKRAFSYKLCPFFFLFFFIEFSTCLLGHWIHYLHVFMLKWKNCFLIEILEQSELGAFFFKI